MFIFCYVTQIQKLSLRKTYPYLKDVLVYAIHSIRNHVMHNVEHKRSIYITHNFLKLLISKLYIS